MQPDRIERLGPVEVPANVGVLNLAQAAAYLDYSEDHFRDKIKPDLAIIRSGGRQSVMKAELDRWAAENEQHTLG